MFLAHRPGVPARIVENETDAHGAAWLDLIDPTEDESELACRITGVTIPKRASLEEIESSSRLFTRNSVAFLSTPLVRRTETDFRSSPLGFVFTSDRLVTVRFEEYGAFDLISRQVASCEESLDANTMLVLLMEAIVDRLADTLEHLGASLNQLSKEVFGGVRPATGKRSSWQRDMLRRVGRSEDLSSVIRDSLLGLDRIAIFVSDTRPHDLSDALTARMHTVMRDISSLNDFDSQMSNKIQFLLDAALGFISIEQNDGMKILTVVSFIGVAPTLIAGIYGMNFKDIPELNWSFGYWYSLGAMALSVLVPLFVFWRRGWFGNPR